MWAFDPRVRAVSHIHRYIFAEMFNFQIGFFEVSSVIDTAGPVMGGINDTADNWSVVPLILPTRVVDP
jgi:hypothetical protein